MDIVKKIDTPYNNAVAVINRTNELLNENNIMDSTGNSIAQLEQNVSNPAWLYALACGSLHTSWQEKLAKAYACLDPQNCEDDQVLVLASIAGIKRGNGTPSHITVILTNTSGSAITIPMGTTFSETYANQTWVLNKNVNLSAHGQQYVTLYTTTDGEYIVTSGITFTYEGDLPLVCESTSDSSGGTTIESISSLRNRISQGEDTSNFLVQAKTAIELLSGIESCTIWFNRSSETSMTIGQGSPSRISVTITNNEEEPVSIPANTTFEDVSTNHTWVLQNKTTIGAGAQVTVTLFSAVGENVTVLSGTNFNYTGPLDISCVASADSVFGTITIPPRTAYLSIKGYDYSGRIAETFFTYLDVPATVGQQQEEYLLGQQPLTMNFDYATENTVKVYVTMRSSDMAVGAEGAIKTAITARSGTLGCGENVTSQMISEWVQNLGYGTVVGCNIGTATGITSNIGPTEYCVFDEDNVIVSSI